MTEPKLDDQELSRLYETNANGHTVGPVYEDDPDTTTCRNEHRNFTVNWFDRFIHDSTYRLCLECNRLYGLDWTGGAVYEAVELVRLASPSQYTGTDTYFYRGWPHWWMNDNVISGETVDSAIETRNEGG